MYFRHIKIILITILISACGGGGGSSSDNNPTPTPTPAPTPAPQPTVNLDGPNSSVYTSVEYEISWTSSNTTSCVAEGAWSGEKSLSGQETFSNAQTGIYTYTLECTGNNGTSASDTVDVTVENPPLSYPINLTFFESDVSSDDIIVSTEEKNSAANSEDMRVSNTGFPVAYTQEEYNKSFIYEGGDLYEINPIFKYFVDVEGEIPVQTFDYQGYAIVDSDENPLFITNVTNERNETSDIGMLVDENQEIIFDFTGNPIFIRSDENQCNLIRDDNNDLILKEVTDVDGNPIYRVLNDGTLEVAIFPIIPSTCIPETDDDGNYIYETVVGIIQEERETECDLSGLGVEVYRKWSLDQDDDQKVLFWLNTPKEILNENCEIGYSEEFAIVSPEFSGIVTDPLVEQIDLTNNYYNPGWIIPGNLDGKNESPNALVLSDSYDWDVDRPGVMWEIIISENRVDFQQATPSTISLYQRMKRGAFNGQYYFGRITGVSGGDACCGYLIEKGVPGFEIINLETIPNCVDLGTKGLGSYDDMRFNVSTLDNGKFIVSDVCGESIGALMLFTPETRTWEPFNYDGSESIWSDYFGCEANNPNDLTQGGFPIPREFINPENGEIIYCRNIKVPHAAIEGSIIKRYGDWIISGDEPDEFWTGSYAHNYITGETTGELSCRNGSRKVGSVNINGQNLSEECDVRTNFHYKNMIHTVDSESELFSRFNLDNDEYVQFDLSNREYIVRDFILFKDVVLVEVLDSSDSNIKYLELNFETGEIIDRGVIENSDYRVVTIIRPSA
tara:strand:- start:1278 stop:3638 length:2361 start_codon:yes stop_codon:yes gene_type:complete